MNLRDLKSETHVPAAATIATKTISAATGFRHVLRKVYWSYSAAPTGGRLQVTGPTNAIDLDITNSGPGVITFNTPCVVSTDLVVSLASGGGTVAGKLYFEYTTEKI